MRINKLSFLLLLSLIAGTTLAQPSFNQPYSILGVGLFMPQGTNSQAGTGYTGIAVTNPLFINSDNPALLSRNRYATFDYSMNWDFNRIASTNEIGNSYSPRLNYFAFSLPITKKSGLGFNSTSAVSFNRLTNSNYSFTTDETVGAAFNRQTYSGEGGLSELRWSFGAEVYSDTASSTSFYMGTNVSFLFGNQEAIATTALYENNTEPEWYQQFVDRTSYSGSHFKPGFAFRKEFTSNYFFDYPSKDSLSSDCYEGEFFILIPSHKGSVPSNKIKSLSEAIRLEKIYDEFRGDFFGVLIKESAAGIAKDTLRKDFIATYKAWKSNEERSAPKFEEFKSYMKRKKGLFWSIGGYYSIGSSLSTEFTSISSQLRTFDDFVASADTTVEGQESKLNLPQSIGFGIGLDRASDDSTSWSLGVDFEYTDWSNSSLNLSTDPQSTFGFSAGYEVTPDINLKTQKSELVKHRKSRSYFRRVTYRAGGYYKTLPYNINGSQVNEFGINFGLGMPLQPLRVKSPINYVNFSLSGGQRGTLTGNKLKEQFILLGISFSVNEKNWFIKRKLGL